MMATGEVRGLGEKDMEHHPTDCPVCLTTFDDAEQRPRTLPCGHTMCTRCVNQLEKQGHVVCPDCRVSHAVPEGGQFPVNFIAETLIQMLRKAEAVADSQLPMTGTRVARQKGVAGLSTKMKTFLQEQEAGVLAAITTCQNVQKQVALYQTTLASWEEHHQQLEDRLWDLADKMRSGRELLQEEKTCMAARLEEVKEGEEQLHATLAMLRTITTEQEAGLAVPEVFRSTGQVEEVVEQCLENYFNEDVVTAVRKVREVAEGALEVSHAALETHPAFTSDLRPLMDPQLWSVSQSGPEVMPASDRYSAVMDRVSTFASLSLKPEDLRRLSKPIRRLLEAGKVFAVHHVKDQRRHARISLEGDQLYLHTLKQLVLPPGARILKLSEVAALSPPCTTFLDLSWPGAKTQRVEIRLSRNTPLGRHFIAMSTGQLGPSYANTKMFDAKERRKGSYLNGGDYEHNDGTGGAAILPDLSKFSYEQSDKEGAVLAWEVQQASGAQFVITVIKPSKVHYNVFGNVLKGMEVLQAAAQLTDVSKVTVVDCGVVVHKDG